MAGLATPIPPMSRYHPARRLWLRSAARWLGAAAAAGPLAGCQRPRHALRLGANLWPGYAPMRCVEEASARSHLVRVLDFHSTGAVMTAFRNGSLDMAALTLDEALLLSASDPQLRVPLVFDVSDGADVLLVRPGIERLQDLRGLRIGFEAAALGAYMTLRALEIGGLTPRDVVFVPVLTSEGEDSFLRGRIDALVTFEPVRAHLLARGAKVLFSSRDIPGEVVDVLVLREGLLDERETELRALLAAHDAARAAMLAAPAEAAQKIGARIELSAAQLQAALAVMHLPDAAESAGLIRHPRALPATAVRLRGVMQRQQLLAADAPDVDLFEGVGRWLAG